MKILRKLTHWHIPNTLHRLGIDTIVDPHHIDILPFITLELTNGCVDYWVGWWHIKTEGAFHPPKFIYNLLKKVLY